MKLEACLTIGWQPSGTPLAKALHRAAQKDLDGVAKKDRAKAYAEALQTLVHKEDTIFALDQLFRRGAEGFGPVKKFIAALADHNPDKKLVCHIDVFAYTFLKKAKNIDLSMPLNTSGDNNWETPETKETLIGWAGQMKRLETYEQLGDSSLEKEERLRYMDLRPLH